MTTQLEERNKALFLEAFDTLFNKRDYDAAARFWSPNYIQHSAHIAPGREGLCNLIRSLPPTLRTLPCAPILDDDGRAQGLLHARDVAIALLDEVNYEELLLRDYVMGVGYQ